MNSLKTPEPAPPYLTEAISTSLPPPTGSSSSTTLFNWSGWLVNPSSVGVAFTEYTEPSITPPTNHCSGASASFWAGLGGRNGAALGQDGTAVGDTGLNANEAWWEYIPTLGTSHMIGLGTTFGAGTLVGALTQYYNGQYSGTVENDNSGSYVPWSSKTHADAPGDTAEAIAERTTAASGNLTALSNYGTIDFDTSSVDNYSQSTLTFFNQFPTDERDQITMLSNTLSKITKESDIGANGSFTDTWLGC